MECYFPAQSSDDSDNSDNKNGAMAATTGSDSGDNSDDNDNKNGTPLRIGMLSTCRIFRQVAPGCPMLPYPHPHYMILFSVASGAPAHFECYKTVVRKFRKTRSKHIKNEINTMNTFYPLWYPR